MSHCGFSAHKITKIFRTGSLLARFFAKFSAICAVNIIGRLRDPCGGRRQTPAGVHAFSGDISPLKAWVSMFYTTPLGVAPYALGRSGLRQSLCFFKRCHTWQETHLAQLVNTLFFQDVSAKQTDSPWQSGLMASILCTCRGNMQLSDHAARCRTLKSTLNTISPAAQRPA